MPSVVNQVPQVGAQVSTTPQEQVLGYNMGVQQLPGPGAVEQALQDKTFAQAVKHGPDSGSKSQASTPQSDASYAVHLQNLQRKLSSVTQLGTTTTPLDSPKVAVEPIATSVTTQHLESSCPNSGTATTEMLSPVRDIDNTQYCTTDTDVHILHEISNHYPKGQIASPLEHRVLDNNDLSNKIEENVKAAADELVSTKEHALGLNLPLENTTTNLLNSSKEDIKSDSAKPPKMERRISRFKVSVVTEPDISKLNVPEKDKVKAKVPEENVDGKDAPSTEKDIGTIINKTFNILEKDITASYTHKQADSTSNTEALNESYVEMLNRQKAEVNGLLEAHRKQQLEYFGTISTDGAKSQKDQEQEHDS